MNGAGLRFPFIFLAMARRGNQAGQGNLGRVEARQQAGAKQASQGDLGKAANSNNQHFCNLMKTSKYNFLLTNLLTINQLLFIIIHRGLYFLTQIFSLTLNTRGIETGREISVKRQCLAPNNFNDNVAEWLRRQTANLLPARVREFESLRCREMFSFLQI